MMNPPLKVNTTLTLEELQEHCRKAPSALAKQRAQVILLRFEGMPPDEVARIVRVTPATVYKMCEQEEVEEALAQQLGYLDRHPELVRGHTLFEWWSEQTSIFPS
jgi:DNA-directed RNA polymerase specialized sigma24 family protein